MRIGIDARFVGPQGTGLGKYTEKLILNQAKINDKSSYFIFLKKSNWDRLKLPKNLTKVLADIPWYSLEEQYKMPAIISSQNLDLLHVPHFNVPIFYRGKFVVTIHDLIHHQFREQAVTTKNPIIFNIKRFGYKKIINHAIKKSEKIIVPSKFIKEEIIKNFKVDPSKVVVTYEAAEEEYFFSTRHPDLEQSEREGSKLFLIYVGNAYPHKNLERLLDAIKILTSNYSLPTTHLTIVCPRDIFSQRLNLQIKEKNLTKFVEVKGYLAAKSLVALFAKATAYVFPSLSEGFGIPGLNAMAVGLPVVASDIPVLKEVYGNAALYFNPHKAQDIAAKIAKVITDKKTKSDLVASGKEQVKKYSWQKMARQTLEVYKEAI